MAQKNKRPSRDNSAVIAGLISFFGNLALWGFLIISMHSDKPTILSQFFPQRIKPKQETEIVAMHMNMPGGAQQAQEEITPQKPLETLVSTKLPEPPKAQTLMKQTTRNDTILSQAEFEDHLDLHLAAHTQAQTTAKKENIKAISQQLEKLDQPASLITQEQQARASLLKPQTTQNNNVMEMNRSLFWKRAQQRLDQAANPLDLNEGSGNSKDIRFYSIRKRLREHLATSCKIALNHACQSAKRAFLSGASPSFRIEVNADGSLACLKMAVPSGSDALDNTFLKAIEGAQPFPELPKHLGITRYSITDEVMVK